MLGGIPNFSPLVRRVTRAAESIKLPSRRKHRPSTRARVPAGPALVRGRGLRRRRPRNPLSSLLPWVLYLSLGAAITSLAFRFLL